GPILRACFNLRALTDNDHLVNGAFELDVLPDAVVLKQTVFMNGPTSGFSYGTETWRHTNPVPPPLATDKTYLALHCNGDLALRRASGTLLWHPNTAGRGVVRLGLTSAGNLVLQNAAGAVVWQSGTGRAAIAANSILPSNQKLSSQRDVEVLGETMTLSMQT